MCSLPHDHTSGRRNAVRPSILSNFDRYGRSPLVMSSSTSRADFNIRPMPSSVFRKEGAVFSSRFELKRDRFGPCTSTLNHFSWLSLKSVIVICYKILSIKYYVHIVVSASNKIKLIYNARESISSR